MAHRNIEIDCLRAFAVIMTIYVHAYLFFYPWDFSLAFHPFRPSTTLGHLFNNCWTGVDLFLIISGYVISKTIVTGIDKLKSENNKLTLFVKAFYIRRIFRIYPLAWGVFFVVLIASFIFNQSNIFSTPENNLEAGVSIFTHTFNYFFATNLYHSHFLSHYWSLSLEEQFYLLLPLFLILTSSNKIRIMILVATLLLITFVIRPLTHGGHFIMMYTHIRCDGLMYGCLIYHLAEQKWFSQLKIKVDSSNKFFWNIIMVILTLVLAALPGLGFSINFVIPGACIVSSFLVIFAIFEEGMLIFYKPIGVILSYFGTRSYALYLLHFPIFALVHEGFCFVLKKGIITDKYLSLSYLTLAVMILLAVTEISHRYLEKPLTEKGRVLSKRALVKDQGEENSTIKSLQQTTIIANLI